MTIPSPVEAPEQGPAGSLPHTEPWALTHLPSHLRLWVVAVLGLVADLWTKEWAFDSLTWGQSRVLIKHVCSLQLSLNPGALFGIGAGLAPIFVGASVLALLFVLYLFANSRISQWSMHTALGLVLAGALGNLYDRATHSAFVLRYPGQGQVVGSLVGENERYYRIGDYPLGTNPRSYEKTAEVRAGLRPVVRDFLKIEARLGGYSLWPWIFNVADALLVVGVGVLLINFWFERQPHGEARQRTAATG